MSDTTAAAPAPTAIGSTFLKRGLLAFAALALLSLAISAGGKQLGRMIALAGHTEDTALREIVIGDDIISAPANTIRFSEQRRDGVASRVDLYLRWPQLDGYSAVARDDFNHIGESSRIIFLSFERRMMSRDMSGRLEPIYAQLLVRPGRPGPAEVTLYDFDPESGYLDETLAVALRHDGGAPFVARCLAEESSAQSLAPCERDIQVGEALSLTYRFPRELLADWEKLDDAVRARAAAMLTTVR
jgi:hypothetical protein